MEYCERRRCFWLGVNTTASSIQITNAARDGSLSSSESPPIIHPAI